MSALFITLKKLCFILGRAFNHHASFVLSLVGSRQHIMDGESAPSDHVILLAINAIQKRVDLACKTQSADLPVFKSEGNKQRFEHATKVSNLIESAITSLDEVDPASAVQSYVSVRTSLNSSRPLPSWLVDSKGVCRR